MRLSDELQKWLDENPEFKGKFIGYKESRGGLGVSRIDNDWWECEDYLIPFTHIKEIINKLKEK